MEKIRKSYEKILLERLISEKNRISEMVEHRFIKVKEAEKKLLWKENKLSKVLKT